MRISEVFTTTIDILKSYDKEHPRAVFEVDGNTVKIKDLVASLNKLVSWLYKDLTDESIEKITRCYDCQYYKKYKKKGSVKGAIFYACSLDKTKRRPDFFCKNGEPKR